MLANVYDAFEKNCQRGPDSNLKTINRKRATLRVRLFGSHAMGFVKRKLCTIVAAASMTSLRGPRVFVIRRPPEVPETLHKRKSLLSVIARPSHSKIAGGPKMARAALSRRAMCGNAQEESNR